MATERLDIMTLGEVADYLRVSIHTVRDWRRKGIMPVYKLPTGSIRVRRCDVEAMLAGEDREGGEE